MSRKKKILFWLLTLIVIIGAAEFFFDRFFNYRNRTSVLERQTLSAYANKPWTDQYFQDTFDCAKQRDVSRAAGRGSYARYILSDITISCVTQYINYDGDKLTRKTWNPDPASIPKNAKVYQVGMFGGSTMMGLGTIDDLTIASHFSKTANEEANKNGVYYNVTNYGVSSHTFTQNVMKLLLLLREREKFDYVVVYGGANDIENAHEAGDVGALIGEKALLAALQGSSFRDKVKAFIQNQVGSCGICKAFVVVSRNTPFLRDTINPHLLKLKRILKFSEGDVAMESDDGLRKFAGEIANYYIKSHDLFDALSRAYDFKYAEFWQPALIYGGEPVGDETRLFASDARLTNEKLKTLYRLTRERVVSAGMDNFYDISSALDERKIAYYTDAVHISGEGNREIAKRILELIGGRLPK